ncbi:MAG TPA: isoprenylcysteine carboxylmethyltransferase family protein [Candidatus Acidoferrales bacterium]|nr:isoprenylcysteine carboxylmethyltransferase family protein [Candidatus Acidoferrales bacterium]
MSAHESDHPDVIALPPYLFAGTLAAGLLLNRVWRPPFVPRPLATLAGAKWLLAGATSMVWAFTAMKRAGTNIDPYEPTTAVVESGPFAFSRNPVYLGMACAYTGIATLARAPVALMLLPPLLALVQARVIEPEERYLEAKFGPAYLAYKARVRRWL